MADNGSFLPTKTLDPQLRRAILQIVAWLAEHEPETLRLALERYAK